MSRHAICPWLGLALVMNLVQTVQAAETNPPPAGAERRSVEYMIIVTGEELLRGVYSDGHVHFLTRTLRPMGCRCVGAMSVDDNRADLHQALAFATKRARLVIVTGGLGPTSNDITRETLAAFTGLEVREHPQALAEMERRFRQPRDQIRDNLRRQTRVPVNGSYLKNPQGTAVGLVFEQPDTVIVALPGPPRELQPMVTDELVPYLQRKFGVQPPGTSLTLRFVGVGQSQIDQVLRDHAPPDEDIFVSSLFDSSRVDFTFALPGSSPADLARLKKLQRQLLEHLGDYFYADDDRTLEEVVVAALRARGGTLVLVEVGSGGNLADRLSRVADINSVLTGAYLAPSEARLPAFLNVSEADWARWPAGGERLKELGGRARRATGSDWVVVVGEIQRPAEGGPFCWVAFGLGNERWEVQRVPVRGSGETAQASLTTQLLDQLRRLLR